MLHLKKLELVGFKSFPERQELRFTGDGVAAIVGPNGCGKSNISDAISWVLGEQSAKTLRGARMQEFIFSGTRDRKPSGLAQVSVTLFDPEGVVLPSRSPKSAGHIKINGATNGGADGANSGANGASHGENRATNGSESAVSGGAPNGTERSPEVERPHEIVVTRKLFRSGESQYLLNGKACRLRDIQDLFLGTGLGPNHYAIIEQGRIEQILSSRPLDRRGFIEEAAGITKFKTRKRLAELKLEGARQNLNRVNDIFQEVTRQVNSLKRQASKARRYEELRGELSERLSMLIAGRHHALDARLRAETERKQAAENAWRECAEKLQTRESELSSLRRRRLQSEQALNLRREELTQLTLEIERLRSRIEQQARTAEDNQARKRGADQELERLDERIEQLRAEVASGEKAVAEAAEQVEQVRGRLHEKTTQVETARKAVHESEEIRERSRVEVIRLLGEASQGRNRLAQIDEFLAGNERQIARLAGEESSTRQEAARLNERRADIAQRLETLEAEMKTLVAGRSEIEQTLAGAEQQSRTLRSETERLQEEFSRLRARRESLDEILSHHAYTTETIKNLFAAIERQPVEGFDPIGILADYVEVDPAFEKATEEFLREELEYVVVHKWEEAGEGLEVLRHDVQGHATFLVHPESPVLAEEPALGPETGVSGRLADAIRLTNGLSGSASTLLPRLRGCYLVEDDQVARRLAVQYPDLHFLMPDGSCYRGYTLSGGKQGSAGPLALKRELRELGPKLTRIEQRVAETSKAVAHLDQIIASNTEELKSVSATLAAAEKNALAADHEMRGVNEEAARAEKRLSITAAELERLRAGNQESAEQREQQRQAIDQLESRRQETEKTLDELSGKIESGRAAVARLAEEQVRCRTELAGLDERRRSAGEALERLRRTVEEHNRRHGETAEQAERWRAEADQLVADNVELGGRVDCHAQENQTLTEEVASLREQIEKSGQQIAEAEPAVEEARDQLDQARERRSGVEMKLVEIRSDLKHLEETCLREMGRPLAEVLPQQPDELTAEQLAAAESEYQQLKDKLESLGAVNVLALEEYTEAKERLDFLETQQKDLLDSIAATEQTIAEIDTVSSSKFQETFDAINRNFREVFQTLFGGGVAEMRLTDEENAGESGVDIIASPPGKRLQNVALLSGGEKSLTAVALLMATFRHRPSPFCVLDEVDAPLDEPNLARFGRLVREMSERTQFILITHSRTTMETAHTLYGVTMQQPGVSQLVSVRMAEHQNGAAKAAHASV